jgi:16S rRNA (adenine1518-N6/adenine1519-N6)-dimethyltransferase
MFAKKSLGQNFLISSIYAKKACDAVDIYEDTTILEIGPGKGFLTHFLLEKAHVIAVEKDTRLINFLNKKFKEEVKKGRLTIISGDVFETDLESVLPENYRVVANIPYYISGKILSLLLESDHQPKEMVLMLQKEVGERIVAKNKKESLLSISVKTFGDPHIVAQVSKENFKPVPKVDSVLLAIKNISKEKLVGLDEKTFFSIVKKGFRFRRKVLKNNLEVSSDILTKCLVKELDRPENLNLNQWICLAQNIS